MPAEFGPFAPLLVASFAAALGLSTLLTPIVGWWATRIGAVARPRQDRWHHRPTPLLGGIAIYIATTVAVVAFSRYDTRLVGVVLGGSVLFAMGLVDDLKHLRPHTKLIVQILAGCLLIVFGVRVETSNLNAIALPLTVFWVVGLTNAFNLLDNMDGLSAGTATIAAFFLALFSISVGNVGLGVLSLAVMGGSLGFLLYNFNPARIFMGDTGSMFLGFTLSAVALLGTREMASDIFFVLLVPALMMALPIFDTTLVTIVRMIEGRPLSQGGRDHLSHRLVALGLSERQAVLLLYAFGIGFGSLGLIARSVGFWTSLAVSGVLILAAILFGVFLAQVRLYGPAEFAQVARTERLEGRPVVNGSIMFKREIAQAALDFALICVAFLGAYLLRFGYQGYAQTVVNGVPLWPALFQETLPIVIVVKMLALAGFRVYRGMWRYVGMSDLLTMAKATIAGAAVLGVLLPMMFRDPVFPRSILVIDWLLFTTLLVGSRLSFAGLGDMFSRAQSAQLPLVLIIGAADLGELVLRSMVRTHPPAYRAAGFLDPDPSKRNRSINGVQVLGTTDELERVVDTMGIDFVVLAIPQGERDVMDDLKVRCETLGVPAYPAATFVELHFAGSLGVEEPAGRTEPLPSDTRPGRPS